MREAQQQGALGPSTASGAHPRPREHPTGSRLLAFRCLLIFGIALCWQTLVTTELIAARQFSSPLLVLDRLWNLVFGEKLWPHLADTAFSSMTALFIAAVLGSALAITLSRHRLLEATLDPILAILQGIPRIAFAPLFVLFLGVGIPAKITLSASIVLFIFYANVQQGLRRLDMTMLRNLQLMGASASQQFRIAVVPSLLPWLWAALELGLGLSLIGVIIAEFISSTRGIGHLIVAASLGFDTTGLVALLVVTMLMVIAMRALFNVARVRYLPRF